MAKLLPVEVFDLIIFGGTGDLAAGMAFTNYQDMQKGDVIECFEVEIIQRAL